MDPITRTHVVGNVVVVVVVGNVVGVVAWNQAGTQRDCLLIGVSDEKDGKSHITSSRP